MTVVDKEGRAAALSFPANLSGKKKRKKAFCGLPQWRDGTGTQARGRRSLRSREFQLAGQFRPIARTSEHPEGVRGSLVSCRLGDIERRRRLANGVLMRLSGPAPYHSARCRSFHSGLGLFCLRVPLAWATAGNWTLMCVLFSDSPRPFPSDFTFLVLGQGTFLGIPFIPQPWAILD